jgi:hypothetical protein
MKKSWLGEQKDGWIDGWMEGWKDGRMHKLINGWRWMDTWTD